MKQAAIFLDRDGTIIKDVGYIKNSNEVEFFPETFTTLLKLQSNFLLFIITNQSGISKGFTTENEVMQVNNYIVAELKSKGIIITEVYCCPHSNEDNCYCKKPKPYFIEEAAKAYNLDLANSYILGDHPSDVYCGLNAKVTPIYVLTGHGEMHRKSLVSDCYVRSNIAEASELIQARIYQKQF